MSVARRHPIVTGLYVPGDRADRFQKAQSSGADLVVVDLEDAVAADRKAMARAAVVAWLADAGDTPVMQVRINAGSEDDLTAVRDLPMHVEVRVPKVESVTDVDRVADALPGRPLTALLESAAGVLCARDIAAHPAVTRVALGEADLASQLGGGAPIIDHARAQLVLAAAAAGVVAPMLSAYPAIDDLDGLRDDTHRGAALGLFGRMAIHPRQLATIADAFAVGPGQVAWAREVLAVTEHGGVARLANGDMVDRAMRERAERILRTAR